MKIFADRRIKTLFLQILDCVGGFTAAAVLLLWNIPQDAAGWIWLAALCMTALILALLLRYFRAEHRTMEQAVQQIEDYLAGSRDARIECDDEGELNRLFHEVNSLAAILNAHAENQQRARQFLKDSISDISHQLKTPLAALSIYNGILQQEQKDPEVVRQFTALSEQELDRIETLVQNLLKVTKLDARTILMEKSEQRVAELMQALGQRFSIQAERQGKRLIFSGGEHVVLFCDAHWIGEALSNLIKNALDHTRTGDFIQIEWCTFASVVQIKVRDTGCGIHPEDLPHIFKRFYRSRFSKDTQGAGLGLALTKSIVEAHGGTIEADSQPGHGTVFTMNFLIPTKL